MKIDKKMSKQIIIIICTSILFYLSVKNIGIVLSAFESIIGYLFPFLLGICIAFIFNIPMCFIEQALKKLTYSKKSKDVKTAKWIRPISILLTLILFLGAITLVFFIVIPEIGRTVESINEMLPSFMLKIEELAVLVEAEIPYVVQQIETLGIDIESINAQVLEFVRNFGFSMVNSSVSLVGSFFSSMLNLFIGLIFSFYILASKEKLSNQAKRTIKALLPEKVSQKIISIASLSHKIFASFFTGQFTEAVILGAMFWVGMSIFNFPYEMMISVLVGFTALIPVFGAFVGCGVGTFLILVNNPSQALWFVIFFLVLQQVEGNLIYPKVVGSSVGLPAIWVLLAVTVGGSMMGVVGMLIFIPVTSVLYALTREYVANKELKRNTLLQADEPCE